MCYLKVLCQEIHSGMFNLMGTLTSWNNTLSGPRRGVKTIPACNSALDGLLHIIDFRHASFIIRLVFAVCTTGNSKQCFETLSLDE